MLENGTRVKYMLVALPRAEARFVCAESSGHVAGASRINKPKTLLQTTYVLRVVNELGGISPEVSAGQVYLQLWMVEHLVCESYEDRSKV